MALTRTVGIGLDGSNLTITFGKVEIRCISASYGDKLEIGNLSFMGSQQIDEQTDGTYTVDEIEIVMSSVNFRTELMKAMPQHGGGLVRIPTVVSYTQNDLGEDSDFIERLRILNWPAAVANSNEAFQLALKCSATQIRWTDERKTINRLRDTQLGAFSF